MPTEGIRRASEMAVVCVRPCVGLCEWDPRVGRSLIPQGADGGGTLLGPLGCVTMLGGLSGWQTQGFRPERPPGIPHRLVTPQWRGWARRPLSLWSSLICVHCAIEFCIYFNHLHCMDLIGSYSIQSIVFRPDTKHSGYSQNKVIWMTCWMQSVNTDL